jgi:hypothetical protein
MIPVDVRGARKSRATANSSVTESTYKVLKIELARFSGRVGGDEK